MPSPFSPLLWGLSSFSMHLDTTVRDCWGVEAEAGWECKEAWSGRSGQSNRVSRTIICGLLSLHDCFLFLIPKLTNATGGRDLCVVCKGRVTMQDVQGHLAAYRMAVLMTVLKRLQRHWEMSLWITTTMEVMCRHPGEKPCLLQEALHTGVVPHLWH